MNPRDPAVDDDRRSANRAAAVRTQHRAHVPRPATSPSGAYWTPDQVGGFYHVNDLFAAGLTGKGKTIALLELGQSRPADTNALPLVLRAAQHREGREHRRRRVSPTSTGTLEAEIDIQEAATQAPGATIISYEAPNTATGEYDAYNRIVTDNRPKWCRRVGASASWRSKPSRAFTASR